jgi:hypothetical protein
MPGVSHCRARDGHLEILDFVKKQRSYEVAAGAKVGDQAWPKRLLAELSGLTYTTFSQVRFGGGAYVAAAGGDRGPQVARGSRTRSQVLDHADRTRDKRLRALARPAVLILDDFAIRELTAAQADDLYELITERAARPLVLTCNRAPADWYPLFPSPVVAESLLDRLINTSNQVFMNGPSYRPSKRPGRVTLAKKEDTT